MVFWSKLKYWTVLSVLNGVILCGHGQIHNDCDIAFAVCSNEAISGVTNGLGRNDFAGQPGAEGCLDQLEHQSMWIRIKVQSGTTLGFDVTPNNPNDDYDFAVYGPNPSCTALGSPVRCSFASNNSGGAATGVGNDTDTSEGSAGGGNIDGYVSWISVSPGEEYVILIDNWSNTNNGFQLDWTSQNNDLNLDCTITCDVDLGADITECENVPVLLDATRTNATYFWSTGETTPTISVLTPGNYIVTVTSNPGQPNECVSVDDINVSFISGPSVTDATLQGCDVGNGEGQYAPGNITNVVTGGDNSLSVSYHASFSDADNDIGPLGATVTTSAALLYARVEESVLSCHSVATITLDAKPGPAANDVTLRECSKTTEATFDLRSIDAKVIGSQTDVSVTYHISPSDAAAGSGPLPDQYISAAKQIYARVFNSVTSCTSVSEITLEIKQAPIINTPDFNRCDDNGNGIGYFDLRNYLKSIRSSNQNFRPSLHPTYNDAVTNGQRLGSRLRVPTSTIYVRTRDRSNGCVSVDSIKLNVVTSPVAPVDGRIMACAGPNGKATFALTDLNGTLGSGSDQVISYHRRQNWAKSGIRALPDTVALSNSAIYFARISDTVSQCTTVVPVALEIGTPNVNILDEKELCYGEIDVLPDGRKVIDSGEYIIIDKDDFCTIDVYKRTFKVCDAAAYCKPNIPSAFTPNQNGQNDNLEYLTPLACTVDITSVRIYDRWGRLVFEKGGGNFQWNGKVNGIDLPEGLYLYVVSYDFVSRDGITGSETLKGSVVLIR